MFGLCRQAGKRVRRADEKCCCPHLLRLWLRRWVFASKSLLSYCCIIYWALLSRLVGYGILRASEFWIISWSREILFYVERKKSHMLKSDNWMVEGWYCTYNTYHIWYGTIGEPLGTSYLFYVPCCWCRLVNMVLYDTILERKKEWTERENNNNNNNNNTRCKIPARSPHHLQLKEHEAITSSKLWFT